MRSLIVCSAFALALLVASAGPARASGCGFGVGLGLGFSFSAWPNCSSNCPPAGYPAPMPVAPYGYPFYAPYPMFNYPGAFPGYGAAPAWNPSLPAPHHIEKEPTKVKDLKEKDLKEKEKLPGSSAE